MPQRLLADRDKRDHFHVDRHPNGFSFLDKHARAAAVNKLVSDTNFLVRTEYNCVRMCERKHIRRTILRQIGNL